MLLANKLLWLFAIILIGFAGLNILYIVNPPKTYTKTQVMTATKTYMSYKLTSKSGKIISVPNDSYNTQPTSNKKLESKTKIVYDVTPLGNTEGISATKYIYVK